MDRRDGCLQSVGPEASGGEGLLNQLVRERLDNGEPLPPGIGYYTKEFISVRGGAATASRRKKSE